MHLKEAKHSINETWCISNPTTNGCPISVLLARGDTVHGGLSLLVSAPTGTKVKHFINEILIPSDTNISSLKFFIFTE